MAVALAAIAGSAVAVDGASANDAPEYCPPVENVRAGDLSSRAGPRFGEFYFRTERRSQIREQVARFEKVIVEFKEPLVEELPTSVHVTCVYRTKLKSADNEWVYLEVAPEPVTDLENIAVSLSLVSYPLTSKYYSRSCNCYKYTCRNRRNRCPF